MAGKNRTAVWTVLGGAVLSLAVRSLAADEVVLKNGSRVVGDIVDLIDGKLKVKTVFAKEIEIDFAEVASLTTDKPFKFVLKDGTEIVGQPAPRAEGSLAVTTQGLPVPVPVDMASIASINAPVKPTWTFKGFVAAGATINKGNTENRSASATGEIEARAEKQRITLRGLTSYADDETGITAQNSRGNLKYDYFITKRLYAFASGFLEHDKFQDLNLRSAVSAGPGYQIIDIGDFQKPWAHDLQLQAEAGISYFNEDFKTGPDQSYAAARWAAKINWPVIPKKVLLFHVHEGYPSLERAKDLYITTEQGVRLAILENFFAAVQVNWRWDNTPSPGRERTDTTYLLSLGYNFSFTKA